jgi:hypothetical protein
MKPTAIQNVLNVWETKNKITRPAKKELYFEVIGTDGEPVCRRFFLLLHPRF